MVWHYSIDLASDLLQLLFQGTLHGITYELWLIQSAIYLLYTDNYYFIRSSFMFQQSRTKEEYEYFFTYHVPWNDLKLPIFGCPVNHELYNIWHILDVPWITKSAYLAHISINCGLCFMDILVIFDCTMHCVLCHLDTNVNVLCIIKDIKCG